MYTAAFTVCGNIYANRLYETNNVSTIRQGEYGSPGHLRETRYFLRETEFQP